jgi:hypothetical protein
VDAARIAAKFRGTAARRDAILREESIISANRGEGMNLRRFV